MTYDRDPAEDRGWVPFIIASVLIAATIAGVFTFIVVPHEQRNTVSSGQSARPGAAIKVTP